MTCSAVFGGEALLQNGGFEAVQTVAGAPTVDEGFGVWKLGEESQSPSHWVLNPAFPGELAVRSEGAHGGHRFIRLRGAGEERGAHLYQPCPGLQAGKGYLVRAWVRGGPASVGFYEYYEDGAIKVQTVLTAAPGPEAWQEVSGYYCPGGAGFKSASLAIMVEKGRSMDVDDVQVEAAPAAAVPAGLEPVVLENELARLKISPQGMLEEFLCQQTGVNYAVQEPPVPMFRMARAGGEVPVHFIERRGEVVEVHFLDPQVKAALKLESRPHYFVVTLDQVRGDHVDWVQLCDLRLNLTENVGTLINAAWNNEFAACVLACNDRTHSFGGDAARADLYARCYREYGLEGAKVALVGVPTGPPDPASQLLDAIEEVELDQGLPHPTLNGVWIKRAPERFYSYLMAHSVGEHNIDQVIEFAKGGFGCIEIYPWRSTPSYTLNPSLFPNGMAGLKKVADKIHAAGLHLGLHVMQGMVGWGPKDDPYLVPKADPRLLQDRHATLAAAVSPEATELVVKENVADWPEQGDLYLEGEIVRYARRTGNGFAECQRGLHNTTVTAHPAGAQVGHLVNCFNMWGSCVYAPDVNSTMIDEVCENIARVFNETDCDMSYFDGGEEVAVQPPHWRNQGRIALGVMQRLKKPVILEGNALYTHLSWHVITRGSPSFDPIYFGRREYTLRAKGQNPAGWAKNLLTGDVGWFAPHVHSLSTDAVTPDEVMLLCLKALGGKAPISFHFNADDPYANKRMPEMLEIIRTCDELKRRDYFSEAVCAELTQPMAEHVLEQTAEGEWTVSPLQFGPPRTLNAQRPEYSEWTYPNPHGEQRPWLRLRARSGLAPYGAKENLVLADFQEAVPFKVDGSASAELVQSVEPSTEKTPAGSSAFCYRAHNQGAARSGWCRLSLPFDPPLNLSNHRRIGVWVKAAGQGGILNVQLANTYGYRDHYLPLDFTGWSYFELDPPEDTRFYEYSWPYNFIDLMYWVFRYHEVTGLNLYYNALPPGAEVACLIGRVEALQEQSVPLVSPALETAGQKMVFPASLKPDEYLEMDWAGRCRHFDPNGGLVAEVQPEGSLRLAPGDNRIRFTCEVNEATTSRAEVTLAVKGEPLPNRRERSSGRDAVRSGPVRASRPPDGRLTAELRTSLVTRHPGPKGEALNILPDGKGGFRLMQGLYELVGRPTSQSIAAFDGVANVWTVENDLQAPCRAVVVIQRGRSMPDVDYEDPRGLVLETFDNLSAYEMSDTNQFEKYVLGGGKRLTQDGPVREGVSQTFVPSAEGTPPLAKGGQGGVCGIYTATNDGGPGGWCAKGKRFPEPLDLSGYEAVALWVHGDGQRETLRFQFRDVEGRYADWLVPIDFIGWRLHVFRTADAPNYDWKTTEYVIFYYNDLPAKATCTMKFDDLKALPKLRKPPSLRRPVLTVNGQTIRLPADLGAQEALILDGRGRYLLWRNGIGQAVGAGLRASPGRGSAVVLQPGSNRFELSCDTSKGVPRDVTVRVIRLGPVGGEP